MQDIYSIIALLYLILVRPLYSIEGHILKGLKSNIIHVRTSTEDGKAFLELGSVRDDKGIGYIFSGRKMKRGNKICLQIF